MEAIDPPKSLEFSSSLLRQKQAASLQHNDPCINLFPQWFSQWCSSNYKPQQWLRSCRTFSRLSRTALTDISGYIATHGFHSYGSNYCIAKATFSCQESKKQKKNVITIESVVSIVCGAVHGPD